VRGRINSVLKTELLRSRHSADDSFCSFFASCNWFGLTPTIFAATAKSIAGFKSTLNSIYCVVLLTQRHIYIYLPEPTKIPILEVAAMTALLFFIALAWLVFDTFRVIEEEQDLERR